ncbi:glycosyltransferase family 4 protein [Megasphaera sueciensis]|uniref:glycosyltransferase family 4 protein n=1 Tax=Megasphaera sueciensis TaxID=349094 RepID=UPI003D01C348
MNILFLTIAWPKLGENNLYTDLMDEFVGHQHNVTVACSIEKRFGCKTYLEEENGIRVLRIKTGNLTKTPFVEKGVSNLFISMQFMRAIDRYFSGEHFELIIMSTPPITLSGVYKKLKYKYNASTYLLLKDIWPQGIADLGLIKNKGLIYKYFSWQEQRLYNTSDFIGCMSPANVKFVKQHNILANKPIVEENPNSIKIRKYNVTKNWEVRKKYGIPDNRCVFLFGGNLGKPQGILSFLNMLKKTDNENAFFLFVGDGTEAKVVSDYSKAHVNNFKFIKRLPKSEYEILCESVDVGLILLDGRYHIPNFPSRLLSYLENKLPVLCCTDASTDIGAIVEKNRCGISVLQGDLKTFNCAVDTLVDNDQYRKEMGNNAFELLENKYTSLQSYQIIINHFLEE